MKNSRDNASMYKFVIDDHVIDECNASQKISPASLAKVMTALLVIEKESNLNANIKILNTDISFGSGNNLKANDCISIIDLLHNLMLASSNSSAIALARHYDGLSNFIADMNAKVVALGMTDTVFTNPHGLVSATQRTTVNDMIKLCKEASKNQTLKEIWSKSIHTIDITGKDVRSFQISNTNELIDEEFVMGGKTGSLSPNVHNLMLHANIRGRNFYGVVLGACTDASRFQLMSEALIKAEQMLERS